MIEEGNVANTRSVRKKVNERREDKLYGRWSTAILSIYSRRAM